MKLMSGTLRPGKVLEHLGEGLIRVSAPGLFSEVDKDKLPPVYPFFGHHDNTYSEPVVGEEVWVLNMADNKRQLHWFRKDDYKEADKNLISGSNVEVLCHRNAKNGWATLYFSDGSGWLIRNGQPFIQIKNDGNILLDIGEENRAIDINKDCISLGVVGESSHKAAFGDVVEEILNQIVTLFESIQSVAVTPHTSPIGSVIASQIQQIKSKIPELVSQNVTLE